MTRFFTTERSVTPLELATCGMKGDPAVDNKLTVSGANQLAISATYSGTAYTFDGLGFKAGDKILLSDPGASGPNDGRELTLTDPSTISVLETLVTPDATEYEFIARRVL